MAQYELSYSNSFDDCNPNLLQLDPALVEHLDKHGEVIVQGTHNSNKDLQMTAVSSPQSISPMC